MEHYSLDDQTETYISGLRQLAAKANWTMKSLDMTGIEFFRAKRYSVATLMIGAVLMFVFGVGLLVLIWGYCEYLAREDEYVFIRMVDLKDRSVELDQFK